MFITTGYVDLLLTSIRKLETRISYILILTFQWLSDHLEFQQGRITQLQVPHYLNTSIIFLKKKSDIRNAWTHEKFTHITIKQQQANLCDISVEVHIQKGIGEFFTLVLRQIFNVISSVNTIYTKEKDNKVYTHYRQNKVNNLYDLIKRE